MSFDTRPDVATRNPDEARSVPASVGAGADLSVGAMSAGIGETALHEAHSEDLAEILPEAP